MTDTLQTPKAVVLLSGGMDSTTLCYLLRSEGYDVHALSVNYGQKHSVELEHAKKFAQNFGIEHNILDLAVLQQFLASQLTTGGVIPEGHYAAENMSQTVVPNRNTILLSIAYGMAISVNAQVVGAAVHAGDHAIYPDCRPAFIKAFEEMEKLAIDREIYGRTCPKLYAPFVMMSKADIVRMGDDLDVDWLSTWSCYNGDATSGHCGRCGTCVERIGAFHAAGVYDPTPYLDREYAINVLREKHEWDDEREQSMKLSRSTSQR